MKIILILAVMGYIASLIVYPLVMIPISLAGVLWMLDSTRKAKQMPDAYEDNH